MVRLGMAPTGKAGDYFVEGAADPNARTRPWRKAAALTSAYPCLGGCACIPRRQEGTAKVETFENMTTQDTLIAEGEVLTATGAEGTMPRQELAVEVGLRNYVRKKDMDKGLGTERGELNWKEVVENNGFAEDTTFTGDVYTGIAYHTKAKGITVAFTPLHTTVAELRMRMDWLIIWGKPPCLRAPTRKGTGYVMNLGFIITLSPVFVTLLITLAIRGSFQPTRRQGRGSNCCGNLDDNPKTIHEALNTMTDVATTIIMEVIRMGPNEELPARPRNTANGWRNRQFDELALQQERLSHAATKAPRGEDSGQKVQYGAAAMPTPPLPPGRNSFAGYRGRLMNGHWVNHSASVGGGGQSNLIPGEIIPVKASSGEKTNE